MERGSGLPAPETPGDPERATRRKPGGVRRFQAISVVAIVVAGVPYIWVLWDLWTNTLNPLNRVSNPVYDVQARAILHGHLSLPKGSIGLDAFIHDGRTYTYFGIFPSLIRIPVILFTHSLDGRLTAFSLLAAWLVTAVFSALLLWRIRVVIRGNALLGRAEATSYGILLFSILAGSVLMYLASQNNYFSEDVAWSVALCSGSLFALLGVVEHPSWGRIATSGLLVLLTNLNRSTTGYACILAGLLIAAWFALGRAGPDRRRWAVPVLAAALVPLVVGCAIDFAKFHIFFGFPASEQLIFKALRLQSVNDGKYFSLRFVPSTLQAYVNPFNVRVTSLFPYVTLPDNPTHATDHTPMFTLAATASVPSSMPLMFGVGIWGVVTTFLPHRPLAVRAFRLLIVSTVATAATVMIFGWVLERYVADFLPLLILASMIGIVDIWDRLRRRRTPVRVLVLTLITLLALFGFVANLGFAATPQSSWTQSQAERYVTVEQSLSDITGHPLSHDVVKGSNEPSSGSLGELWIQGNCEDLYIASPKVLTPYTPAWVRVERAPHTPICRSLIASTTIAPLHTYIALPTSGESVSGPEVHLVAVGSGGHAISSVSFVLTGGSLPAPRTLGHVTNSSSTSVWDYPWDSRSVPNGSYVLRSMATDTAGHRATSPGIKLIVHNPTAGT